ncbi:uncharacterized protein TNCV_4760791 [Trichonephila clavipes]|uniref:Uncharacterized protein n=1 Tax=Trichonephila clavipes TaxID=2585209 RepID=A0A8X6REJ7_TRICX|nr:uncharacterized protein TNCV_4760791 [Trichonephila clavipes]
MPKRGICLQKEAGNSDNGCHQKHNLGYVISLEAKEDSCLNDSFSLTIAERQDKRRISQNISTKQKKRKRNATNTNAAYSAGAF